ncbi:hypothetical protein [Saccharomonospora piscinae]|nr:hypothetical protein [Saccharomonospora piscinae]
MNATIRVDNEAAAKTYLAQGWQRAEAKQSTSKRTKRAETRKSDKDE